MPGGEVVLFGQRRWTEQLARGLRGVGLEVQAVGVDKALDAVSVAALRKVRAASLVVRVGFRPGASSRRGLGIDVVLKTLMPPGSQQAMYWLGTDVLHEVHERQANIPVANWRTTANCVAHHLAGSDLLQQELAQVGIDSRLVPFPFFPATPKNGMPGMPDRFTVLSYVPDERHVFYGGPLIVRLAELYPDMQFRVMGGVGRWLNQCPSNLTFLGWLPEAEGAYADSSCVIRIPEHDSLGATAAEGLMFGRPVLYVNHLDHASHVQRDITSIGAALTKLWDLHLRGVLRPDGGAAAWARQEFDPDRRFRRLANVLRELHERALT